MLCSAALCSGGRLLVAILKQGVIYTFCNGNPFDFLPETGFCEGEKKSHCLPGRQKSFPFDWESKAVLWCKFYMNFKHRIVCITALSDMHNIFLSCIKWGMLCHFFATYNCLEVKYKGCVSKMKCSLIILRCLCQLQCLSEAIVLFWCFSI